MNLSLLNGMFDGLKNWFMSILDNVPKAIYFFVACINSAIDALQCLMRKLAGLDVYYTKGTSTWTSNNGAWGDNAWNDVLGYEGTNKYQQGLNPVRNQDPLSEFIYGILGIGDNAAAYKALNTVFWSLSVFALILLLLSTMVAIIKSHYNEDYQTTNPWKYIYTAIKAVLTYALMPVIVVVGMTISSFLLRTLDNITSGADEGKITSIYGTTVVSQCFNAEQVDGKNVYAQYDFFGEGNPTTNSTFGGMLFQAAAYSANRVRSSPASGAISIDQAKQFVINGQSIFANSSSPQWSETQNQDITSQREFIAYQIDYAFMNNFRFKEKQNGVDTTVSMGSISNIFKDVRYVSINNLIGGNPAMEGFSKFNITAVWFFYDLWNFNFIVAFAGAATVIGIMLSIIIGLMSRLIKGAALFLLYPPLLGIAPLDSFKAFKNLGTQFMQQILMAFGAIIGMNIMLLILPYVQNIKWFGPGFELIDSIINLIILITGLCMTKEFIGLVSQFVGGADAAGVGEGLKGQVAGSIKTGVSRAVSFGSGVAKVGGAAVKAGVKGGVKVGKAISHARKARILDKAKDANLESGLDSQLEARAADQARIQAKSKAEEMDNAIKGGAAGQARYLKAHPEDAAALQAGAEAYRNAGGSNRKATPEQKAAAHEAAKAAMESSLQAPLTASIKDSLIKEQKENVTQTTRTGKVKETEYDRAVLDSLGDNKKAQRLYKRATKFNRQMADGKFTLAQNEDGYYGGKMTTKNGKQVNARGFNVFTRETMGDPLKKKWQGEDGQSGMKGFLKGLGKKISEDFDSLSVGRAMGDAFLKSMRSFGSGLGLDKAIGNLKDTMQRGFTFKGGVEKPVLSGDALERKNAADASTAAKNQLTAQQETNKLLTGLIKEMQDQKRVLNDQKNALDRLGSTTFRPGS